MIDIFKKLFILRSISAGGQKNIKIFKVITFVIVIAVFFVSANSVQAAQIEEVLPGLGNVILGGVGYAVATVLGLIALILTTVIGLLITVVVKILITVAQYGNIINVPTVIQGWVIVRDLCNMSFILILLIIAFATILRQENFSAKKILPKLLIMAVLINFSRTIFGLLIDFSQVIMLTFVNAFAAGGGHFIQAFNTNWLLSMKANPLHAGDFAVTTWSTSVAIIAGVLAAIITLIVMSVMLAVLVARIVMLWIYTIFSPLVFLGFAFPPLQKYTGKIWEDFTKQLVVGPVLAFFIWLALTTAQTSTDILAGKANDAEICAGVGAFFCEGRLQQFIIVIGLLMGGLITAQSMGGAAGKIASKGMDWGKKGSLGAYNWGGRHFASFQGLKLGRRDAATGERARIFRGFEIRPDKIIGGVKRSLDEKAARQERSIKADAGTQMKEGRLLGITGASEDFMDEAAQGVLWNRLWRTSDKGALFSTFKTGRANNKIAKLQGEKKAARVKLEVDTGYQEKIKKIESERQIAQAELEAAPKKQDRKRAQKKIDDLDGQKQKAAADLEANPAYKEKMKEINGKIEEQEEVLKKYRAPEPYEGIAARQQAMNEEAKKLADNDNEDDLVDKFINAYKQGNKELAGAIFLHAAKVGHSNEMLEMVKVLKDVHNDKGELLSSEAKGDTFTANGAGLKAMVNQYFKKGLGMSDQEAHSLQNQFSTLAQHARHYNLAQSIGSRNGILYQRDDETQKKRTVNELMKTDVEKLWRDLNRLGHGGEITYHSIGPDGEKQEKRIADFDEQSLEILLKTAATALQEFKDRQRGNTNNALNGYNTFKVELEINGNKELGLAPNKELGAAITSPFMSILKRLKQSGSENEVFYDKNGDKATYRELALEFLKFGRTKYEAATFSDLTGKIPTEKDEGKKEKLKKTLEREKELGVKIGAWIDKELAEIPGYKEKEAARQKNKSKKKTEDELPPD